MRQMDDNLIVRIVTIQTLFMSVLLTAGHWLQLHGQHFGNQVSFYSCYTNTNNSQYG